MDEEEINYESTLFDAWTKEEKFKLYKALGVYGSSDIEQISNFISTKSKEEIRTALYYFKENALTHPVRQSMKKDRKKSGGQSSIPLANWAKLIMDSKEFEELETDTSFALRMIADFEDKPPSGNTDFKIDLKKVYYILANAMDGKSIQNDKIIPSIIEQCVIETAFTSKAFVTPYQLNNIINNINLSDKLTNNNFRKVSPTHHETNIQYLSSQEEYNPLKIAQNVLKSS